MVEVNEIGIRTNRALRWGSIGAIVAPTVLAGASLALASSIGMLPVGLAAWGSHAAGMWDAGTIMTPLLASAGVGAVAGGVLGSVTAGGEIDRAVADAERKQLLAQAQARKAAMVGAGVGMGLPSMATPAMMMGSEAALGGVFPPAGLPNLPPGQGAGSALGKP